MAWIRVIHDDEATGELAAHYKEAQERGRPVSNVEAIMSLNPPAMTAADALHRSWSEDGVLSRRHQEMVAVVTSAINRCYY